MELLRVHWGGFVGTYSNASNESSFGLGMLAESSVSGSDVDMSELLSSEPSESEGGGEGESEFLLSIPSEDMPLTLIVEMGCSLLGCVEHSVLICFPRMH